jgi:hypothetical protein
VTWLFTALPMLAGLLPLAVGLAIVISAVVRLRRNRRLRTVGIPVTATVVDNQVISGTEGRVSFAPVLTYRTREGREIKTAGSNRSHKSYIAGSAIEIQYDPDRPDRVLVPGESAVPYLALVLGLVFVLFGTVVIVVTGVMGHLFGSFFGMFGDSPTEPNLPDFPHGD